MVRLGTEVPFFPHDSCFILTFMSYEIEPPAHHLKECQSTTKASDFQGDSTLREKLFVHVHPMSDTTQSLAHSACSRIASERV